MKRESVIFGLFKPESKAVVLATAGSLLWFCVIGLIAGVTANESGVKPFYAFIIGLGFGFAPMILGIVELLILNVLGSISDMFCALFPSEENNLRKAESALHIAKLRLETEKTLIEARRIEQDRLKISDAAINSELLEAARVADMAHSDTRNGHHRLVSKL